MRPRGSSINGSSVCGRLVIRSLIAGIVAADGESFWSGQGAVAGRDYPDRWQSLVRAVDALEFTVTGRAAEDPYLFIS